MPPVRSVQIGSTGCVITSKDGTRTLSYASVPSTANTLARAETFANAWAAANSSGYQVRFHVVQRTPLRLTVWTANLGVSVPANWWLD